MTTTILQGTVPGGRKPGRQKIRWEDNIKDWTNLTIAETHQLTKDREAWRTLVYTEHFLSKLLYSHEFGAH